jgi:dTDP-glucose 4,6-dehydratase
MSEQVLVTGADGFIGSHLVESLVETGSRVRALVHYNPRGSCGWLDCIAEEVRAELEVVPGDVRDSHGMHHIMNGCDVVVHLAALIGIPYSYYSPGSYVDTNINGTLNVLQAARDSEVRRVVHTSTSEVYGSARYVPIDEEHPLNGQSPYAASKIGADQLAMSFYYSFDLPVTIIRPFNTYGPRQSARAVIPTVIAQIAAGRRRIKLGSLEPTRDFTFVEDVVRGFMAALGPEAAIGEVTNLGSGYGISVGETASLIAALMDVQIEILLDEQRIRPESSEVVRLLADVSKAGQILDWHPSLSGREGLCDGLSKTIEWFSDPKNLALYKPDLYNL